VARVRGDEPIVLTGFGAQPECGPRVQGWTVIVPTANTLADFTCIGAIAAELMGATMSRGNHLPRGDLPARSGPCLVRGRQVASGM